MENCAKASGLLAATYVEVPIAVVFIVQSVLMSMLKVSARNVRPPKIVRTEQTTMKTLTDLC